MCFGKFDLLNLLSRRILCAIIAGCFSFTALADEVKATDYGAIPGDGKCAAAAINKAIESCSPGDRLVFEPGTYDLWDTIAVENKKELEIIGNGAILLLRGFDRSDGGPVFSAIRVRSSERITIRDFVVDMDVSPNTAGEVVYVDDDTFDLNVFEEFQVTGTEKIDRMMTFHRDGRPNGRNFDLIGEHYSVEKVEDRVLRIRVNSASRLSVGELVCLYHKVYGGVAIYFGDTTNCTVQDVTIQAFAGMGFVASDRSTNVTLERYRVLPPAASKRLASTNADGSKFVLTGGRLTIKDCEYEGMGDDAINIHSSFGKVAAVNQSESSIQICRARDSAVISKRYIMIGDLIEFYDKDKLLSKGSAHVVERDGDVIKLDGLPHGLNKDDLFNNLTMSPQARICGVTVRRNRARGFLLQTQDVVVENCKIYDPTGVGIFVTTDVVRWYESGPGKDIVIRNNYIENANNHLCMEGAITVKCGHDAGGTDFPAGVHRNIRIEGNTIKNTVGSGVFVCATDGVYIKNNVLTQCSQAPVLPSGKYAIYLKNSQNVVINGNQIKQSGLPFKAFNCENVESDMTSDVGKTFIYAADYTTQAGCTIQSDVQNALAMDGENALARWSYIVVPFSGVYDLVFRYANGSEQSRTCSLVVNGVTAQTLNFRPTGCWSKWNTWTLPIVLHAGRNELILSATTNHGGPSLESLNFINKNFSKTF